MRVFLFTVMVATLTACESDVPYQKITLIEIFDTSFYHSDIAPGNNYRFDKPYVINNTDELHEFLDSWHITDYQASFDSDTCSIIVVQSILDYDIVSVKTRYFMYNDTKERVFKIDYTVYDAHLVPDKFYQMVICQVPKIDSGTEISFGYSVYSEQ